MQSQNSEFWQNHLIIILSCGPVHGIISNRFPHSDWVGRVLLRCKSWAVASGSTLLKVCYPQQWEVLFSSCSTIAVVWSIIKTAGLLSQSLFSITEWWKAIKRFAGLQRNRHVIAFHFILLFFRIECLQTLPYHLC